MKLIKPLALLLLSAFLIMPADAKGNNNANKKAQQKKEQQEKERADRKRKSEALKEFMEPRDANHDGSLSKDEFMSGETDKAEGEKRFKQCNTNGDRTLTKSEIEDLLGL